MSKNAICLCIYIWTMFPESLNGWTGWRYWKSGRTVSGCQRLPDSHRKLHYLVYSLEAKRLLNWPCMKLNNIHLMWQLNHKNIYVWHFLKNCAPPFPNTSEFGCKYFILGNQHFSCAIPVNNSINSVWAERGDIL